MSKVTDKFQITLPKVLAERYGIRPGDVIRFEAADEAIRLLPAHRSKSAARLDIAARLRLFDAATARQRTRERAPRSRVAGLVGRFTTGTIPIQIDSDVPV